jgi:CheY-like chemotaxis protein
MTPKILFVDDDAVWLQLMREELSHAAPPFSVATMESGQEALELLAADHISAVVSDLRMPGIDGFELVSRMSKQYPDIPVMIVTAYDRPKTREVVFKSGACDYMVKPLGTGDLIERINRMLRAQSEGGSLNNVSLETFLQLIEMEAQTCTLRVVDRSGSRMGVLFFRDGDLVSARLGSLLGHKAAYEILSWSGVSLSIENACPVTQKLINGGLQAMLLNAMRKKDENQEDFSPDEESAADQILLDSPVDFEDEDMQAEYIENFSTTSGSQAQNQSTSDRAKSFKENSHAPTAGAAHKPSAPQASVRNKFHSLLRNNSGVEDIYEDQQYERLLTEADRIGKALGGGDLSAVYLNQKSSGQKVLVPGPQITVILLSPDVSRDRIMDLLI